MKLQINLNTILIIAAFILLWFFKDCGSESAPGSVDTLRTEIVYKFDTTIHRITDHKIYYSPGPDEFVIEPETFDSSEIVEEYFTHHFFVDSLIDSNLTAAFSGILYKNRLYEPNFYYTITRPQTVITNIITEEKKNKVYLGGFVSYTDKPTIGALLTFQNKKDRLLTLGYGTGPTYYLGAQVKIKLR